jgi:2-keto-4-pentenoate hydratase
VTTSTSGPATTTGPVEQAALRLHEAALTRTPCAPVRDLIGSDDVGLAYATQSVLTARALAGGARVVGRKIGLTSEAVQRQLGVDQPDFGVLFDGMQRSEDELIDAGVLLQPKIEAEIAFVLAEDIDDPHATATSVRGAVAYAVAALEIVDSRIADWDISYADTVADNASSGLFVLGRRVALLDDFAPDAVAMTMTIDGEPVSAGTGAACLGDPLNALAWLARTASVTGDPLRAGQIVLSGALGPMAPVRPGNRVSASITGVGTVHARFAPSPLDPSEGQA